MITLAFPVNKFHSYKQENSNIQIQSFLIIINMYKQDGNRNPSSFHSRLYIVDPQLSESDDLLMIKKELRKKQINYHEEVGFQKIKHLILDTNNKNIVIINNSHIQDRDIPSQIIERPPYLQIYCFPKATKRFSTIKNIGQIIKKVQQKQNMSVYKPDKIQIKSMKRNISKSPDRHLHDVYEEIIISDRYHAGQAYKALFNALILQPSVREIRGQNELAHTKLKKSLLVTQIDSVSQINNFLIDERLSNKIDLAVLGVKKAGSLHRANVKIVTEEPLEIIQFIQQAGIDTTDIYNRYSQSIKMNKIQHNSEQSSSQNIKKIQKKSRHSSILTQNDYEKHPQLLKKQAPFAIHQTNVLDQLVGEQANGTGNPTNKKKSMIKKINKKDQKLTNNQISSNYIFRKEIMEWDVLMTTPNNFITVKSGQSIPHPYNFRQTINQERKDSLSIHNQYHNENTSSKGQIGEQVRQLQQHRSTQRSCENEGNYLAVEEDVQNCQQKPNQSERIILASFGQKNAKNFEVARQPQRKLENQMKSEYERAKYELKKLDSKPSLELIGKQSPKIIRNSLISQPIHRVEPGSTQNRDYGDQEGWRKVIPTNRNKQIQYRESNQVESNLNTPTHKESVVYKKYQSNNPLGTNQKKTSLKNDQDLQPNYGFKSSNNGSMDQYQYKQPINFSHQQTDTSYNNNNNIRSKIINSEPLDYNNYQKTVDKSGRVIYVSKHNRPIKYDHDTKIYRTPQQQTFNQPSHRNIKDYHPGEKNITSRKVREPFSIVGYSENKSLAKYKQVNDHSQSKSPMIIKTTVIDHRNYSSIKKDPNEKISYNVAPYRVLRTDQYESKGYKRPIQKNISENQVVTYDRTQSPYSTMNHNQNTHGIRHSNNQPHYNHFQSSSQDTQQFFKEYGTHNHSRTVLQNDKPHLNIKNNAHEKVDPQKYVIYKSSRQNSNSNRSIGTLPINSPKQTSDSQYTNNEYNRMHLKNIYYSRNDSEKHDSSYSKNNYGSIHQHQTSGNHTGQYIPANCDSKQVIFVDKLHQNLQKYIESNFPDSYQIAYFSDNSELQLDKDALVFLHPDGQNFDIPVKNFESVYMLGYTSKVPSGAVRIQVSDLEYIL